MKTSFLVLLLGLFGSLGSQAADQACAQRVKNSKQDLAQAQSDFAQGNATALDVVNAKLVLVEAMYDCTPFVKYNYCKFRQDLLRTKIVLVGQENSQSTSELTPTEQELESAIRYCLDPRKQKGSPR